MKKLILFLLLPLWTIAQTSTGQEQEFDYGIKNNSTQTITTPPYLTTTGMDGTQGKIPSVLIEKTDNKQNSLAVDGTGTKFPTVDAVNASTVSFNPKTTKIALLGDSITLGVGSTTGTTSYADILNSFFGFQTYTKLGFSSMTVKPTSPRPQLSDKIALIPAGTNYITLMIGINDWAENNVIGDVNAVMAKTYASLDQTLSFAEAFRYNLETIKNNFPDAEIRVITPIKHDSTWVRALDFKFYVEAEIAIANFLSIPIINAFDASGIYKSSTTQYIPDGIHPNDAGYSAIASVVKKGLIEKNTEHYSNTSFNQKLFGKPEFVSLAGNSEILRITGVGYNGGSDNIGGFSLGLFFNSSGNRYAYLGGSDSVKKLLFSSNVIDAWNFTTNQYTDMQLSQTGKRVSIGSTLGSGGLLNVGNFGFNVANNIVGISGATGQTGDYLSVVDVNNSAILRVRGNGSLVIGTSPTTSSGTFDVLTRDIISGNIEKIPSSNLHTATIFTSTASTGTAPLIVASATKVTNLNADLLDGLNSTDLANISSPAFTGTPTAPTATVGTNNLEIANTAFVQTAIGNYKKYVALLTQSGTNNPTPTVLENTLSGTVVWTRNSTGLYTGTLAGVFTANKTWTSITSTATGTVTGAVSTSVDTVTVATSSLDSSLTNSAIEIRVYN